MERKYIFNFGLILINVYLIILYPVCLITCVHDLDVIAFPVINVSLLLKIHQITIDTGVAMDYVLLGNQDHNDHRVSCDQLLASLLAKGYFSEARLVSEILGFPDDSITVGQVSV